MGDEGDPAFGITHLHFALANSNIPMIEYFPMPCWDSLPDAEIEPIFHGEPQPGNGKVVVEPRPGLGVEVNEKIFS